MSTTMTTTPAATATMIRSSSSSMASAAASATSMKSKQLRPIIIDGDDVGHWGVVARQADFDFARIRKVVGFFEQRGHKIYLILPHRLRESFLQQKPPKEEEHVLLEMERKHQVCYVPSRRVSDMLIECDDDAQILKLAYEKKAIVVSNDDFAECLGGGSGGNNGGGGGHFLSFDAAYVVKEQVLAYMFVDGKFEPFERPLGRAGPPLDEFLRDTNYDRPCPYFNCMYGGKCKYWHPKEHLANVAAAAAAACRKKENDSSSIVKRYQMTPMLIPTGPASKPAAIDHMADDYENWPPLKAAATNPPAPAAAPAAKDAREVLLEFFKPEQVSLILARFKDVKDAEELIYLGNSMFF